MRIEEDVSNHERRVDGASALREVELADDDDVLQLVVLKALAPPTADDSNSSVRDEEIFMVEYYEILSCAYHR